MWVNRCPITGVGLVGWVGRLRNRKGGKVGNWELLVCGKDLGFEDGEAVKHRVPRYVTMSYENSCNKPTEEGE